MTRSTVRFAMNRRHLLLTSAGALGAMAWQGGHARQAASGEVTVGVSEDGYRTDERANVGFYPLNTNIFESLVRLTNDYQIEPLLAERWELVEPSTWRFFLRQGVTFHDGTPFTSAAVKYTTDRLAGNGGGVIGVTAESTVIVDDHTVEITPGTTNIRMVQQLNHPNLSILPPDLNPAESRVGTGPFREVEYVAGDHYTVAANPDYWGEDVAQVGQVIFRFYPDPTSRLLALQAGDVDMIIDVPRQSAEQVEGIGATLVTSEVGAYEAMYVNIHGAEPYDLGADPAIREAISLGIDRQVVIDSAWQGNAEPGTTMIPPAILGNAAAGVAEPTTDAAAAANALEAAGWVVGADGIRGKDGRPLTLTLINGFGTAADHGTVPDLLQAQLKEIGIGVEIVQTPDTATYEGRLALGEGNLWLEAGSQNDANPGFLPGLLFSSPEPGGDPEANMYGNAFAAGAEFDALIDLSLTSTDMDEVRQASADAMNLLISEERIVIPLCGFYRICGFGSAIGGLDVHPSGINQRWTSLVRAE